MDTPHGLLVPNVKDVRNKSLLEIAEDLARLQADASAGKLGMADLKGGTFSISNIGNLGGTYTGPVVNLPEVAIVGLGKARPTPKYDAEGNLVKMSMMQVPGEGRPSTARARARQRARSAQRLRVSPCTLARGRRRALPCT